MQTEYAVFDQDGNQLGFPVRAFATREAADTFRIGLIEVRERVLLEGKESDAALRDPETEMTQSVRAMHFDAVIRGERAAGISYTVMQREVGTWTVTA